MPGLCLSPPPPLSGNVDAGLSPRRSGSAGGIPGRSVKRRPSSLLAWNSLPPTGSASPCGSRERRAREGHWGWVHPEPPRPPPKAQRLGGPRSHSNPDQNPRCTRGAQGNGEAEESQQRLPQGPPPNTHRVAQKGKQRPGEGQGLAQGHLRGLRPLTPALTFPAGEPGIPERWLWVVCEKDPTVNEGDPEITAGGDSQQRLAISGSQAGHPRAPHVVLPRTPWLPPPRCPALDCLEATLPLVSRNGLSSLSPQGKLRPEPREPKDARARRQSCKAEPADLGWGGAQRRLGLGRSPPGRGQGQEQQPPPHTPPGSPPKGSAGRPGARPGVRGDGWGQGQVPGRRGRPQRRSAPTRPRTPASRLLPRRRRLLQKPESMRRKSGDRAGGCRGGEARA